MIRSLRVVLALFVIAPALVTRAHAQGSEWTALAGGVDDHVTCLAVYDDGSGPALYAGGRFRHAGDVEANNIARWDGASWHPLGRGLQGGSQAEWSVANALVVHDDGTGPQLYVTGDFTTAGNVVANGIARWNGASWSALGSGLTGGFRPRGMSLHAFDAGAGRALYVGGAFAFAGPTPAAALAAWDGAQWLDVGGGMPGPDAFVSALSDFDDGSGAQLYAGGNFVQAGAAAASCLARWDGTAWSVVPAWPTSGEVPLCMLVHDDGSGPALFVAGRLHSGSGSAVVRGIVRWDGTNWSNLGGGIGWNGDDHGHVQALASYDDGVTRALYAGGSFRGMGDIEAPDLARWDGSGWSQLAWTGAVTFVDALASHTPAGATRPRLVVGGAFRTLGGATSQGIGEWEPLSLASFCVDGGPYDYVSCGCGPSSIPGTGCAWSSGHGARLSASGSHQPVDALTLDATLLPPSTTVVYMTSSFATADNFGMGTICIGSPRLLFGARPTSAGNTSYPGPGDPPLSVVSGATVGTGVTAYYQVVYRNPGATCPGGSFNLTNGIKVVW